jgi:antitoxin YefM
VTHVSYTDLRQNLARYLDEAVVNRAPITVIRQGGKGNVVLIAEQEFAGLQETIHLLSSPANAEALLRSVDELNAGRSVEHELVVPSPTEPA